VQKIGHDGSLKNYIQFVSSHFYAIRSTDTGPYVMRLPALGTSILAYGGDDKYA
jgi:hypothetical protein